MNRLTWRDKISGSVYATTDDYSIRERLCELEEAIERGELALCLIPAIQLKGGPDA